MPLHHDHFAANISLFYISFLTHIFSSFEAGNQRKIYIKRGSVHILFSLSKFAPMFSLHTFLLPTMKNAFNSRLFPLPTT